jgi:hypothetical protein
MGLLSSISKLLPRPVRTDPAFQDEVLTLLRKIMSDLDTLTTNLQVATANIEAMTGVIQQVANDTSSLLAINGQLATEVKALQDQIAAGGSAPVDLTGVIALSDALNTKLTGVLGTLQTLDAQVA